MGNYESDPQEERIDVRQLLDDMGASHLASMQIEAHGDIFSVIEAGERCRPFARQLVAMAIGLEVIEDKAMRSMVFEKQVSGLGKGTTAEQLQQDDPQKKTTFSLIPNLPRLATS